MADSSSSHEIKFSDETRLSHRNLGSGSDRLRPAPADEDLIAGQSTLGDFRLIRQIGRGGMGVVYEAEQLSLGRRVAVKVLPYAAMLDPQHRKRFQNEARAAATLDHPHIVPVHFVGQERGVHFYAMHLIEGNSMAQLIEEMRGRSQSPTDQSAGRGENADNSESPAHRAETVIGFGSTVTKPHNDNHSHFFQTVARLGAEAAEALHHAHQIGILHRDVKPGNLLIDTTGKLWVADFGLATIEHSETLTRTGGVVGTAAYMSPEQACDSHQIDGRSDIYSLGATLYELLTLRRHRSDDVTRPALLISTSEYSIPWKHAAHTIPVDLETIVTKAVAVLPDDRYQNAGELADDLRRYIAGREIKARRLTVLQRGSRWLRSHQPLTASVVVASFLLIGLFGTLMFLSSRQLSKYAQQLEAALTDAEAARGEAEKQSRLARERLRQVEQSEQAAIASEQSAKASEQYVRRMGYRGDMQRAFDSFTRADYADTARLLYRQQPDDGQQDLRGLEWQLLHTELNGTFARLGSHDGGATECCLFPQGDRVATAGEDGIVRVWDVRGRKQLATFNPHIGPIYALAISPDGESLAVGGQPQAATLGMALVYLIDSATGKRKQLIQGHPTTIESIEFSADGQFIAAGSRYKYVQVSTLAGRTLHTFKGEARNDSIALIDQGRLLITRNDSDRVRLWDVQSGQPVADWSLGFGVGAISVSRTRRQLAVAGKNRAQIDLLQLDSGDRIGTLELPIPRPSELTTMSISNDGTTLVAGDTKGKIYQWSIGSDDTDAEIELTALPITAQNSAVTSIAYLNAGEIVTTHRDGSIMVSATRSAAARIHQLPFPVSAAKILNRASVFLGTPDGTLHHLDVETQTLKSIGSSAEVAVEDLAIDPTGTRLAVVYRTGEINVHDLVNQRVIWSRNDHFDREEPLFRVALSPAGQLVARTGADDRMIVWRAGHPRPIIDKMLPGDGMDVTFSSDGRMVAFGRHHVQVLLTESGSLIHSRPHQQIGAMRFGPRGRYLATGHNDGAITLVELPEMNEVVMEGHASPVRGLVFDTAGQTLLTADGDGRSHTIRCTDTETQEVYGEINNPLARPHAAFPSAYEMHAADNRLIICGVGSSASEIAIWDWSPGLPTAAP